MVKRWHNGGGSFMSHERLSGRESLKVGWRGAVRSGGGACLL
jgi:hypothetical protein